MLKALGLGMGVVVATAMGALLVFWAMNCIGACIAMVLSIASIKKRAKAPWCKRMRIYYLRRRFPIAEH